MKQVKKPEYIIRTLRKLRKELEILDSRLEHIAMARMPEKIEIIDDAGNTLTRIDSMVNVIDTCLLRLEDEYEDPDFKDFYIWRSETEFIPDSEKLIKHGNNLIRRYNWR